MQYAQSNTAGDEMRPSLEDLAIVLLSHNRVDAITNYLPNLVALCEKNGCELIVVDNGSTDKSVQEIEQAINGSPNTKLVQNSENLGVAGGRNSGWKVVTREFLLNLDDDTIINEEAIVTLLTALRDNERLGIVSPSILHAKTRDPQLWFDIPTCSIANYHGACHMMRSSLLSSVGYIDEKCTFGGEELDMSIRSRAQGYDVGYVGQAIVLHDNIIRTGKIGQARRKMRSYNIPRLFFKHFPVRTALPISARYVLSQLVSGLREHGALFALSLIASALRGVREGRLEHTPVPVDVENFYRNPDLTPDFGNVPIYRKLTRMLTTRGSTNSTLA